MDHQFTHTVFSFYLCSLALDVLFIILMISFVTLCVAFFTLWPDLNFALSSNSSQGPVTESIQGKCSFELPIQRRRTAISGGFVKRGAYSGSTGLGDYLDLFYSVSIAIGKTVTAVNLDTGSSDLWVISDTCNTRECKTTNMPVYPSADIQPAGGSVNLLYGDSLTGTHASGPLARDVVAVAGLSMPQQAFAAISDTNNPGVIYGLNGIFGLGFPSGRYDSSQVQYAITNAKFSNLSTTDDLILGTAVDGPLLSRFAISDSLEQPMFAVMLQRDMIDVSGSYGAFAIGKLPDGIDNSSLTWVPVRLYKPEDGGLDPPTFAPGEIYPYRWEVPIDGVMLDGQQLPASALPGSGSAISALIDTGNSLVRGPEDVVDAILKQVSPAFAANPNADPTFPCVVPHELAFQIGGGAGTCIASSIFMTDPPSRGALFSWSLGDPFFKSNLVAFYYGNLTHPSVDPPRIGFLSIVPANASSIVQSIVSQAQANSGHFESTSQAAPTNVATNVLLETTSVQFPAIASSSSSSSSRPDIPSASPTSGGPTNVGPASALCTILIPTFFGTILLF